MNPKGIIIFSSSSGGLFYTGKNKKARFLVVKSIINILVTKLKYLHNKPIALHLKNTQFIKN